MSPYGFLSTSAPKFAKRRAGPESRARPAHEALAQLGARVDAGQEARLAGRNGTYKCLTTTARSARFSASACPSKWKPRGVTVVGANEPRGLRPVCPSISFLPSRPKRSKQWAVFVLRLLSPSAHGVLQLPTLSPNTQSWRRSEGRRERDRRTARRTRHMASNASKDKKRAADFSHFLKSIDDSGIALQLQLRIHLGIYILLACVAILWCLLSKTSARGPFRKRAWRTTALIAWDGFGALPFQQPLQARARKRTLPTETRSTATNITKAQEGADRALELRNTGTWAQEEPPTQRNNGSSSMAHTLRGRRHWPKAAKGPRDTRTGATL